eukprot:3446182-Prymnesium_polylepis.3
MRTLRSVCHRDADTEVQSVVASAMRAPVRITTRGTAADAIRAPLACASQDGARRATFRACAHEIDEDVAVQRLAEAHVPTVADNKVDHTGGADGRTRETHHAALARRLELLVDWKERGLALEGERALPATRTMPSRSVRTDSRRHDVTARSSARRRSPAESAVSGRQSRA